MPSESFPILFPLNSLDKSLFMSAIKHQAEKAYLNEKFLTSPEARIVRIMTEYMEPRARLNRERIKDMIVFFGSARIKSHEEAAALKLQVEDPEH